MSYNRGKYLLNCVRSIQRNFQFNYELIVFDDGSNDPETVWILDKLMQEINVFRISADNKSKKHKGLYANMNHSLQRAMDKGFELLAIFQDDTQVIRLVTERELRRLNDILDLPAIGSIVPLFFKKNHQKDYKNLLAYNQEYEFYYARSNSQMYLNGIADMGFFSVRKLAACGWEFENHETLNIKKGLEAGFKRVVLKNPFLAYLPWPETHRHRITNFNDWVTGLTDIWFRAGFHPFKDLSDEGRRKLFERPHEVIPFAEDYLELVEAVNLTQPWNYYESSFPVRYKLKSMLKKVYHAFDKI